MQHTIAVKEAMHNLSRKFLQWHTGHALVQGAGSLGSMDQHRFTFHQPTLSFSIKTAVLGTPMLKSTYLLNQNLGNFGILFLSSNVKGSDTFIICHIHQLPVIAEELANSSAGKR